MSARDPKEKAGLAGPPPAPGGRDRPPRVLVVDDEAVNRQLVSSILESEGFETRHAETGESVFAIAETGIDLILLDVLLPDVKGYEVCRRLKRDPETVEIPVIFLSVLEDEESQVEGLEAGGVDFVTKPIHAEELKARVKTHLELFRTKRTLQDRNAALLAEVARRKRIEQDLRTERDRISHYLDISAAILLGLDLDGKINLINEDGARILGARREDIIGKNWVTAFLPERVRDGVRGVLKKLLSGDVASVEYVDNLILTRSGEERIIRWHNSVVRDGQGEIAGILASGEDITERKRAEEALLESEQTLHLAQEIAAIGHFVWDLTDDSLVWSPNMYAIAGIDPANFAGNLSDVIDRGLHPDDRDRIRGEIAAMIEQRKTWSMEFRYLRPDGEMRWLRSASQFFFDDTGRPVKCVGVHFDATETVRARKSLEESEARFRETADLLPTMIFEMTLEGRITYANRQAFEKLKVTREAFDAGYSGFSALAPEDRDKAQKRVETLARDRTVTPTEYTLVSTTGERIPAMATTTLIERDGKPVGLRGVFTDLTAIKEAEKARRDALERLTSFFDHSPSAIFIKDLEGRIIATNKTLNALFGLSDREIVGKTDFDLYLDDPPVAEAVRANDRLVAEKGEPMSFQETVVARGETRHYLTVKFPLRDEHGNVMAVGGIATDVTERRLLEERMAETQKFESLGVLAGGIAHDFNNILMAILGNAAVASKKLPAMSGAHTHLAAIEKASQRASDLCKQMLAYSGKGKFVMEDVDLSALVREMTNILDVSVSKKAKLRLDLETGLALVEADASQISQVILNLITNASEALEESPGTILLSAGMASLTGEDLKTMHAGQNRPPGDYAFLAVRDTGRGMDEETRARLFDPFFSTKFTGRGLGLSAVLGIVRGHGGAIRVASTPGKGAEIIVYLPVSRRVAAAPPAARVETPVTGVMRGKTLLLVDDEDQVLELVGGVLADEGYRVLTAATGVEALEHYRAHHELIDVVVLDLTMPEMDGAETLSRLRKLDLDLPVLLTSGFSEDVIREKYGDQDRCDFLQKPFLPDELCRALNRLLSGHRPV